MAVFDRRLILHFDWTMFSLALGLCLVGLISVLSATHGGAGRVLNPLVLRQFIWMTIARSALLPTRCTEGQSLCWPSSQSPAR